MLASAEAMREYLLLLPREYHADTREGRFARDGLRSRVYEFCDAGTTLGRAFRTANPGLDLRLADEMRYDLAHNYPAVTPEAVWTFAREEVPRLVRKLRRAKFSVR